MTIFHNARPAKIAALVVLGTVLSASSAFALKKGQYTFVPVYAKTVPVLRPVMEQDTTLHFEDTPAGIIVWHGAGGWRCIGSPAGCAEFMKSIKA